MNKGLDKLRREMTREEFIEKYGEYGKCPGEFGLVQNCREHNVCSACMREAVKDIQFKGDIDPTDIERAADKELTKGKGINELVQEAHQNAVEHGWGDEEVSFGDLIALCHSELSEALEEYRTRHKTTEIYFSCSRERDCDTKEKQAYMCEGCEDRKPEGIPTELADVVIRIFDMCGRYGIDLEEAIRIKMEYNKTRPYKHGGKII